MYVQRHSRRRIPAFSLVEMAAVLAIMAVVALVARPSLMGFVQRDRTVRAAHKVAADLRYAQSQAVLRQWGSCVQYAPDASAYVLWNDYGTHWAVMADPVRLGQIYFHRLADDPDYRMQIEAADFSGETKVFFNAYGLPSSGGTVTLGTGNLRISINVDAATGRVTVGELTEAKELADPNRTPLEKLVFPNPGTGDAFNPGNAPALGSGGGEEPTLDEIIDQQNQETSGSDGSGLLDVVDDLVGSIGLGG